MSKADMAESFYWIVFAYVVFMIFMATVGKRWL